MIKGNTLGISAGVVGERAAGPVTFVLSTDEVDRHGDIVCADGWRLEAYRENPVLLWAHDYRHPAIGRAVAVWSEPHRLLAQMEFAPSAFAQEIAALYAAGFQWGVSVGFRPIRWEDRRDSRPGVYAGLKYLEQELLEVSAVPVPANRSALRRGTEPEVPGFAGMTSLEGLLAELRAVRAEPAGGRELQHRTGLPESLAISEAAGAASSETGESRLYPYQFTSLTHT